MECSYDLTVCSCATTEYQWLTNLSHVYLPRECLAPAVLYSVDLLVCLVVLGLNIVSICQKKTDFLMRAFIYETIPITVLLVIYWLNNIPAFFTPTAASMEGFCNYMRNIFMGTQGTAGCLLIIAICGCSISIILLLKVCNTCCTCCTRRRPRRNQSMLQRVCLEVVLVVLLFVVPVLIYVVISIVLHSFCYVHLINIICVSIGILSFFLSFITDFVLLIWVCPVNIQLQRQRRVAVNKDIGIFWIHSLFAAIVSAVSFFNDHLYMYPDTCETHKVMLVLLTLIALFPLCVFVYIRYSHHISTRELNRQARNLRRHGIQTAGIQTVPPSTRVSLPSDTAAHAPNFLSPSTAEPTDVTPLLN